MTAEALPCLGTPDMELDSLQSLLRLLREHGVTEYSQGGLTLKLGVSQSGSVSHSPAVIEPELPPALKKLNPNYMHPSLLKVTRLDKA